MAFESRRDFIKAAGLVTGGLAVLGLAGCTTNEKKAESPAENTSHPAPADGGAMGWKEMDRLHKEGMKAFPAKTEGKGNQVLSYKMDGDVKVFELTVDEIDWEVTPGNKVKAMAYNKMVPGPVFRVTEGDKVRIKVTNNMQESTAIHWHGLRVPNSMDGVTYLNQDPITPGATFTYEFVAKPAGTHMYHSHHNSAKQVTSGLAGAFIVDPKDKSKEPAYDKEYVVFLNDTAIGLTINGKGFPATEPFEAKPGQRIRFRFLNMGVMYHPMHLHGMHKHIIARDGLPLQFPYDCDTLTVGPGERYDAIVLADEPGVWAFHCHVLPHAESEHGMFGMVTALIVK